MDKNTTLKKPLNRKEKEFQVKSQTGKHVIKNEEEEEEEVDLDDSMFFLKAKHKVFGKQLTIFYPNKWGCLWSVLLFLIFTLIILIGIEC